MNRLYPILEPVSVPCPTCIIWWSSELPLFPYSQLYYINSALGLYFPWDACLFPGATALDTHALRFIPVIILIPVGIATVAILMWVKHNEFIHFTLLVYTLYILNIHSTLRVYTLYILNITPLFLSTHCTYWTSLHSSCLHTVYILNIHSTLRVYTLYILNITPLFLSTYCTYWTYTPLLLSTYCTYWTYPPLLFGL